MKKTTFMLVALTSLLACRRERPVDPAGKPGLFTLAQARAWYDSQQKSSAVLDGGGGTKLFSLGETNADLSSAQSLDTRQGNYWLVSLQGSMLYRNYRQGYRKLAIKRDTAGRIYARILEIIPDGLYFQRKNKASTHDFTGRIFVYDAHYQLLGGRLFSDGKLTGTIKVAAKPAAQNGLHLDNIKEVTTCEWYNDNYINAEGEVTIYSERICTTTTIDDGSTGGSFDGGSGDYLGSPAGGSGGTSAGPPQGSNLPGESGAAIRPRSYMDCFSNIPDAGANMKITVFVQEPFPGTSFNIGPNSVGHVAIGLTKSNGSQSITQIVGYYPAASGIYKYHCPSKILNNGGDLDYNVSITYNVPAANFQAIANYISNPPTTYDLMDFNCTSFVYTACKTGGITLPDPMNTVGLGGPGGVSTAMTPAGLGASIEKLKGQNNVNTNGGTTPNSKGPCD